MENSTPMLKQYDSIKAKHKDCILFFRLGDFYEMFYDDAKKASGILDIVLTSRGTGKSGKVPMCGVPYHAADSYNEDIALRTHPQLIKKPEIALRNILSGEDIARFDTDIVVRKVCRNSLMAGDKISPEEALHLRTELVKCLNPFTCPHGRPTVVEIKDKALEKEFLRK